MSEFEKYIADKNSVWGKRRNNQGGRQLEPTEIAEMLNELDRARNAAQQSRARLVGLVRAKNIETDVMASDIRNLEAQLSAVVIANATENDNLRAELEAAKAKGTEQSEYVQSHGLTDFEMARLKRERDAVLVDAQVMATHWDYGDGHLFDCSILDNGICNCDSAIVKKYIDPAQPALPLAFSECPECGMTHAPGKNTLCSQ